MLRKRETIESEPVSSGRIALLKISSREDAQQAVDIARENPVVLHLNGGEENRRLLDFISGAIYAIGGMVYVVSSRVYLLAPEGCEVQQDERLDTDGAYAIFDQEMETWLE